MAKEFEVQWEGELPGTPHHTLGEYVAATATEAVA